MAVLLILLILFIGSIAHPHWDEAIKAYIDNNEAWCHMGCLAMCRFRDYSEGGVCTQFMADEDRRANDRFDCKCYGLEKRSCDHNSQDDCVVYTSITQPRHFLQSSMLEFMDYAKMTRTIKRHGLIKRKRRSAKRPLLQFPLPPLEFEIPAVSQGFLFPQGMPRMPDNGVLLSFPASPPLSPDFRRRFNLKL